MFSHSQHAGTCTLLCTLPYSPLTYHTPKSYAYNINNDNDACAHTHTHTHTHTHPHTHAHACAHSHTCAHIIPMTSTTFTGLVTTTVPVLKIERVSTRLVVVVVVAQPHMHAYACAHASSVMEPKSHRSLPKHLPQNKVKWSLRIHCGENAAAVD